MREWKREIERDREKERRGEIKKYRLRLSSIDRQSKLYGYKIKLGSFSHSFILCFFFAPFRFFVLDWEKVFIVLWSLGEFSIECPLFCVGERFQRSG